MTSTPSELRKSMPSSVAEDPRWTRIVARDKTADGHLWYSVLTTGIYCRNRAPRARPIPRMFSSTIIIGEREGDRLPALQTV